MQHLRALKGKRYYNFCKKALLFYRKAKQKKNLMAVRLSAGIFPLTLRVMLMALLQYGLPQVSSVCLGAEKVGWMADQTVRSDPNIECRNQTLHLMAFNAEPTGNGRENW